MTVLSHEQARRKKKCELKRMKGDRLTPGSSYETEDNVIKTKGSKHTHKERRRRQSELARRKARPPIFYLCSSSSSNVYEYWRGKGHDTSYSDCILISIVRDRFHSPFRERKRERGMEEVRLRRREIRNMLLYSIFYYPGESVLAPTLNILRVSVDAMHFYTHYTKHLHG